jgi:hypothetical protein
MATISYPTDLRIQGPWLLEPSDLLRLDSVVDSHVERLRAERKTVVSDALEEFWEWRLKAGIYSEEKLAKVRQGGEEYESDFRAAVGYKDQPDERNLVIYLSGGREVEVKSFAEAINLSSASNDTPLGFRYRIHIGRVEAAITLAKGYGSPDLKIDVSPNSRESAKDFFGALQNWATDIQPSRWQQRWLKHHELFAAAVFVWICSYLMVALLVFSSSPPNPYKQEARRLIENGGVKADNQPRAIELLLAIESDATTSGAAPTAKPGLRFWLYFILGIIVLTALAFCPAVAIGFWAGRTKLKRAQSWNKTITATVPSVVIFSIALPWLLRLFGLK